MRLYFCALLPFIAACTNQPSHIPNPLVLPAVGVSTAVENTLYGARRGKVKRYVAANWDALQTDITKGSGAALTAAMDTARVPPAKRPPLIHELRAHAVHRASPENLTVALMVHS